MIGLTSPARAQAVKTLNQYRTYERDVFVDERQIVAVYQRVRDETTIILQGGIEVQVAEDPAHVAELCGPRVDPNAKWPTT